MNPIILAQIIRMTPYLIASATALNVMQQGQAISHAVITANNANNFTQMVLGVSRFVGFAPIRAVGGALGGLYHGAFGPALRLVNQNRGYIEEGLLIKVIKRPDEMLTIVTGPEFGIFILRNAAMVIVAIVVFIVVKNVSTMLINHISAYTYYKQKDLDRQDSKDQGPLYLN